MKADSLRDKFLQFFKSRKHKIIESDSLVPQDDPTVLFTPAGMNQFKKEFLGFDSGFKRAATSQRCLRTDDLDKVGKTSVHHTFFEMLGNFSFGDYSKKEAILWAWEFLTEELNIPKDKLWVSVYKDDDEACGIWKDVIGVAPQRILKLGDKDNFWPAEAKEKGPNGPCGPCSEIFFDFGPEAGCREKICDPSCSCGRFAEIWNLVFTQYNRQEGGKLTPLPNKNIDTGMGLERLAAVMQGKLNNFETDLFQPIIEEIVKIENVTRSPNIKSPDVYAIADHIRAIVFAIYDGVLPSNEGRGYVVRKIIRKADLHLRILGIKNPFLYKLVPVLAQIMKVPYPELEKRRESISGIILAEEKNFIATLETSGVLFNEKFKGNPAPEKTGIIAFQLYDTYGIPLEITLEWLKEKGIQFSREAFDKELKLQKNRSKSQSSMKGDVFSKGIDLGVKDTKFIGYTKDSAKAKILAIISGDRLILDSTPFYAESGGQVGDTGIIKKGKNIFSVCDTKKIGNVFVHFGKIESGFFKAGDTVEAKVDLKRRLAIANNHTATHILQAALRKVLGEHVQQQGSLVAEERLRFDFTHFQKLSESEIQRVEEFVNQAVAKNLPVKVKEMDVKEAKKSGALAFFGEKYGGKVRVVSVKGISSELCGGTHLKATGTIGTFKIAQEGSVASGVRRIEALTGASADNKIREDQEKKLREAEDKEKRLAQIQEQAAQKKPDPFEGALDSLIQNAEAVNGINFISRLVEGADMNVLRKNVDLLKQKVPSAVIALGGIADGRAMLVIGVTTDLCAKGIDAGKLVRSVADCFGGSGGGRSDFAQAGGNNPSGAAGALKKLREELK